MTCIGQEEGGSIKPNDSRTSVKRGRITARDGMIMEGKWKGSGGKVQLKRPPAKP